MRYRPEIDGLRALAVIPVILFHAGFGLFSGGVAGVDIFFVISGYLITDILLKNLQADSFSLTHFYERRMRRILPALFFITAVTIPFAWMWLTPRDLKDFAESLVAVAGFSSNILFWMETGYFETESALKPLLHTWSLAVEEQYYILFPLFLMLTWRHAPRAIFKLLVTLFALSLGTAILLPVLTSDPQIDSANFFLLPTRGWEILAGGLIAFYTRNIQTAPLRPSIAQAASLAGLLLIALSVFWLDSAARFPGLPALLPVGGACLVILYAHEGTWAQWLLRQRVLVGMGLISYSAYLWHHPLFALVKYRSLTMPSPEMMLALCLATIPLAYLSWRFIEQPFRDKNIIKRSTVFMFGGLGIFALLCIGLGYLLLDSSKYSARAGNTGPQTVMLLGDSHAQHLTLGLRVKLGTRIGNYVSHGCIPFYNVDRYDSRYTPGECSQKTNAQLEKFEQSKTLRTIVLSTMGPVYLDNTAFNNKHPARVHGQHVVLTTDPSITDPWQVFETGMRDTLRRLSALPDKKIIFVLDVPELGIDARECATPLRTVQILATDFGTGGWHYNNCVVPREAFDARVARFHSLVRHVLAEFPDVILFDPTNLFCDDTQCYGTIGDQRLYRDADHLSEFGSLYLAQTLAPVILQTLP